jgi:hypothetical protein
MAAMRVHPPDRLEPRIAASSRRPCEARRPAFDSLAARGQALEQGIAPLAIEARRARRPEPSSGWRLRPQSSARICWLFPQSWPARDRGTMSARRQSSVTLV